MRGIIISSRPCSHSSDQLLPIWCANKIQSISIKMLLGRCDKRNLRASLICAFAFAGLMLISNDQGPGHMEELFRATNKRHGRGLTANGYEKALRRALASTTNAMSMSMSMSMEKVDYKEIVRRALAETSSNSRSLTSDNPNYKIIKAAQNIREENDGKVPFVFVMQATVGMIPMIKSWICNTATMENVHENTLLIVDEQGKRLLGDFEPAKGMHIVLDSLPKEMQGSWAYGTLGYWLATQNRFHTVLEIVDLGKVPIMIIEPDAVWLENPLDDPAIVDSDANIVGFVDGKNGGGDIGFGFLRMNPTDTVIDLLRIAGASVDETLKAAAERAGNDPASRVRRVTGEQAFFSSLIRSFTKKHPDANLLEVLPECHYPSGQWYLPKSGIMEKCQKEDKDSGSIVVLQNNWIAGNGAKASRAKAWGHWFLSKKEDRCLRTDLKIARQSVVSGSKPTAEELIEEM